MENNQARLSYYQLDNSGLNYLSIQGTHYCHSELLESDTIRIIECYIEEKWMTVKEKHIESVQWNEIDTCELQHGDIIDLSDQGDRWEGNSLNGEPFSFGCIYNSENQLIYSGFIFEGLKVCYGEELYGDVGLVEYEGNFYNGMRYGNGKLYDKKNALVYEGEWYNNNPLEIKSIRIDRELKEEDIHFGLEELEIGDDCLDNIECFKLIGYDRLKKLILHKNSLKNLNSLVISNNNELTIIEIEDGEGRSFDESRNTGVCYNVKNVEISSIF